MSPFEPEVFTVTSSGEITRDVGFDPLTRDEAYDLSVTWIETAKKLTSEMRTCYPLLSFVADLYREARMAMEKRLGEAEGRSDRDAVEALRDQLAAMPEEPEDGVEDWVLSLSSEEYRGVVFPNLARWLRDEPDMIRERDYIPDHKFPASAAMEFFRDELDAEQCRQLGVRVVEGDRPGSTYFGAELTVPLEEAVRRAAQMGLPIRFERADEGR